MKKRIFYLFILIFVTTGLIQAQSLKKDPRVTSALKLIEIWIDAQLAYNDIPGMSAAIVYDQDLVWSRGFGYADQDKKIPASPTTIYSICSISKLFTSISVMQLRDQGKLRLDVPIKTYLPWFNIKDTYPDAPEVDLAGILTHSSGLPRESDFPYWTGPEHNFPTRKQIIEKLSSQEELYPADTYMQYSNLGLTLAGEVVAAVSGTSYANYVQQHILDPLGLKDTFPEIPQDHKGEKLATGYSRPRRDGNRKTIPFYLVRGIAPAAGFASTVEDLSRFASWQFRLLDKGGTEVLSSNTLKEMHRVHWLDQDWKSKRGLGFSVWRHNEKTFVGHGGSCPGYKSHLAICPKEKIAVIIMTNALEVSPAQYTQQIFDIISPAISKAIKSPDTAKKSYPDLEKFVGRYEGWAETYVMIKDGDLAMIYLPSDNPLRSLTKLKQVKGNIFRRVRDDGNLGEKVVFEIDPDGKAKGFIRHSNYSVRIE